MRAWKLVSGIICCVLTVLVMLQSCAATIGETLSEAETADGAAGLLVAILMLAAGIISIATRDSASIGGEIAMAALFSLAANVGFANSTYYGDLAVWSFWCVACGLVAIASLLRKAFAR